LSDRAIEVSKGETIAAPNRKRTPNWKKYDVNIKITKRKEAQSAGLRQVLERSPAAFSLIRIGGGAISIT